VDIVDMKLELVVLPVTDVDRAKAFYEQVGFRLDVDHEISEEFRVVQLTPPGSECSITIGKGMTPSPPGTAQGLHLVVTDIEAARAELAGRGIDVSEPFHFGPEGQTSGVHPERSDYNSFATFSDPDGNGWLLQEVKYRNPDR
jgi:catechol 2,3-dioxygenase-like lactoylglutathione lyase family enzyme